MTNQIRGRVDGRAFFLVRDAAGKPYRYGCAACTRDYKTLDSFARHRCEAAEPAEEPADDTNTAAEEG